MDPVERVLSKLRSHPNAVSVFVPSEEEIAAFFEEESKVRTASGMPMINRALEEARKRTHHLVFIESGLIDRVPHHGMTMESRDGKLAGFDVPDDLRFEVEGRDDLVWLSDDFVVDPGYMDGEIFMVMHPHPVRFVGEEEGVRDAQIIYPALSVDGLIRRTYGVDPSGRFASGILSFNLI